jgi:hypothetical protein
MNGNSEIYTGPTENGLMTASEQTPDGPRTAAENNLLMHDLAAFEPPRPEEGFSLASLFLLVTVGGVIAFLAREIVETKVDFSLVQIHAIVGAVVGGIVGLIIGAGYPLKRGGMTLGGFVGVFTGGVCAATAASGGSPWLFCFGAAALLALGFASRWLYR